VNTIFRATGEREKKEKREREREKTPLKIVNIVLMPGKLIIS
jgi:hypothetical protein